MVKEVREKNIYILTVLFAKRFSRQKTAIVIIAQI